MMNTTMLTTCCLGAAFLSASITGCVSRECTPEEQREAEATGGDSCDVITTVQAHETEDQTEELDYTAGMNLSVRGDFRNLEIEGGGPDGQVLVIHHARVDLAEGRSDEVVEATLEELNFSASSTPSAITVTSDRSGDSNVAAVIQVRLPNDFDGNITVDQNGTDNHGGELKIGFTGVATNLEVDLNALGTDFILENEVAYLESVLVNVNSGDITTSDFMSPTFRGATLSSERGDIRTGFTRVPTALDVLVEAKNGDITVGLPGTGNYAMQATTPDFNLTGTVPEGCDTAQNEGGGSATCNEGADTITFTLLAEDGSVTVDRFVN